MVLGRWEGVRVEQTLAGREGPAGMGAGPSSLEPAVKGLHARRRKAFWLVAGESVTENCS